MYATTSNRGCELGDPQMVHVLPTDGQPTIEERDIFAVIIGAADAMGIESTDSMCKQVQKQQTQSNGNMAVL